MCEIADFEPKWPMPQTCAEVSDLARSLMVTKKRLSEVVGVSPSTLSRQLLSRQTKKRLQPLLDIFNRAIWMTKDEKRAAFWMNYGFPQGMASASPLDWIARGGAGKVRMAQEAQIVGGFA